MHTTKDCCKCEKDGTVKANFCTAKKAGKKPKPAKQLFAQLSKKLDKQGKSLLKRHLLNLRNAAGTIAIPIANRKLGWVALEN
jgi:hypothetical protein